jgi:hypothetical protein
VGPNAATERIKESADMNSAAVIHYEPGNFEVIVPGSYVVCAVSGQRIPLEHLKYWNAERQEAYATADIATRRHEELRHR